MTSHTGAYQPDHLDLALLGALRANPRVGDLELSRLVKVARATVQSRLRRLEESGVIAGWGPEIDVTAAGYPVQAFVTLEIAQGALDDVLAELSSLPNVLEAYVTTGDADVLCKVGASSHLDLQDALLAINRTGVIVRSTSVVVLSTLIAPRSMPLLGTLISAREPRAPAYR
ncbi:Lrp/AsnC family transcriptional regulator [Jatrophihabitans telluris]|uniref:Lrp/AsnC family transcriptional regulator n=1 Tax=Jatrophihabitans telluris TaxID=2038343 RepID=A0ABY4QTE8_9ACTN|nr:Lrp/AsnC family transcriptional regulator [Jatrophihabitans telluris]UQX86943.1 Lrp/AsnC family transcriptional regulator [Jatrophihabitans telluris]